MRSHLLRGRTAARPLAAGLLLLGCALSTGAAAQSMSAMPAGAVPEAVRVPGGHRVKLETAARGELTYACRRAAAAGFEWGFVAPVATLADRTGRPVGRYYGGPTWEAADGSKFTGKQVAVAPGAADAIPLQLVRAEPGTGQGTMSGISYVQRLATRGGVAPKTPCGEANLGEQVRVPYTADYILWTPAG